MTTRKSPWRARRTGGFTLLEVLLAVGLSSILLVTLAAALHTFVGLTDLSRTKIEEIKLARQVLAMISRDLTNVVLDQPQDLADRIQPVAATSSQQSETDQVNTILGELGLDANGQPLTEDPAAEDPAAGQTTDPMAEDTQTVESPYPKPGITGTQYDIYIDSAHPPRYDELQANLDAVDRREDPPKLDYTSVGYYIRSGPLFDPYDTTPLVLMDPELGGLVRSTMDRVSEKLALDWGAEGYAKEQLLAPEIVYLEFRYFDGTDWLTEYDSQTTGELPKAVEITIALTPIRDGLARTEAYDALTVDEAGQDADLPMYRETVMLRAESTATDATAAATTDAATTDANAGANGAAGGTGGTGGTAGG